MTRTEDWVFTSAVTSRTVVLGDRRDPGGGGSDESVRMASTSISWTLVAAVWIYNLIWMVILGAVRLITERFANYRTDRHVKSIGVANQSLQPHITTSGSEPLAQS